MRALPSVLLVALAATAAACFIPVARNNGTAPASSGQYASNDPYASGGGTSGSDGSDGYGGGGGSYGSSGTAGASGSSGSAPAAAGPVSVTIRSACSKTVPVFYGDKPGYSSGTTSSVSSNSVSSHTFQDGDQMWVLDDRGEGVGNVTISQSTRNIEINSSCGGISAR